MHLVGLGQVPSAHVDAWDLVVDTCIPTAPIVHTHRDRLVVTSILHRFVDLLEMTTKLSPTCRVEECSLNVRALFFYADFAEVVLDEDHSIRSKRVRLRGHRNVSTRIKVGERDREKRSVNIAQNKLNVLCEEQWPTRSIYGRLQIKKKIRDWTAKVHYACQIFAMLPSSSIQLLHGIGHQMLATTCFFLQRFAKSAVSDDDVQC